MVIMAVVLETTVCIVECSHGGLSAREETNSGTCVRNSTGEVHLMPPHRDIGEIKAVTRQHVETGSTNIVAVLIFLNREAYIYCVF